MSGPAAREARSFSQETKDGLSQFPVKAVHCRRAELLALLSALGQYLFDEAGHLSLWLQGENPAALRRAEYLITALGGAAPQAGVVRSGKKRQPLYTLWLRRPEAAGRLLKGLGLMNAKGALRELEAAPPAAVLAKECCRKAYLRGAFLASGFVDDPLQRYHMEIVPANDEVKDTLENILGKFSVEYRLTVRKGNEVLYWKDSEQIADMLTLLGAYQSRLRWENARIFRSTQGDVNRRVNCETANLAKTAQTGARQQAVIAELKESGRLSALPHSLRELAELRLDNPDVSLEELGQMLDPPLGKSGVNHRLRRIEQFARTEE